MCDYEDVFNVTDLETKPLANAVHSIPLIEGETAPFMPLYNLSQTELKTLRDYLSEGQDKGWIQKSKSPAGAPILFVPKKDGTLRLCVDYRGLNKSTIKNRCPLPLISETLARLSGSKVFSKIDLKDAYHRIPIAEGDRWKTAFRTRYGHFKYKVMPFGLTNALATFQAYINESLVGLLDEFCVVYLDDILIYSDSREEHTCHLHRVCERLRRASLFANLKKCQFFTETVEFLGYILSVEGVSMDMTRVASIQEWPQPKNLKEVQSFLGFANFYRRFIPGYAKVAVGLTDLTKSTVKGKQVGAFIWTERAGESFRLLKAAFVSAPLLRHFDPARPIKVETDASVFALGAILLQPGDDGRFHPVAFCSRKMEDAETRYETYDQELLGIVYAFKQWRHFLEGASHPIEVLTDHNNLTRLKSVAKLVPRQARWMSYLSSFDFTISHQAGKRNPADAPSRRSDYERQRDSSHEFLPVLQRKLFALDQSGEMQPMIKRIAAGTRSILNDRWIGVDPPMVTSLERDTLSQCRYPSLVLEGVYPNPSFCRSVVVCAVRNEKAYAVVSDDMLDLIAAAQRRDEFAKKLISRCESKEFAGKDEWHLEKKVLCYKQAIYVPVDHTIRYVLLKLHHDGELAGHFGPDRTGELLKRKYYWPGMNDDVNWYVKSCVLCQGSKARRHKPYGDLSSLPVPQLPFQELTMDFITDLPASVLDGVTFDGILVIMDRLTKMATYVATVKTLRADELAGLFIKHIICRYGVPDGIVSDRGSVFTSAYWADFAFALNTKRRLSTAFHPQTDGQTERQNQTLEHYLRCYCSEERNDWAERLPSAEFAYNNSRQSLSGMTPFKALMGYDPQLAKSARDAPPGEGVPSAIERVKKIIHLRDHLMSRLRVARESQAKYYNAKHQPRSYNVGDLVLLSTKNLQLKEPKKKLSFKYIGPFKVLQAIGRQAYRLALPSKYRVHDVFHVSLLEAFHAREHAAIAEMPLPALDDDGEEAYKVEAILQEKGPATKRSYYVKWLDWSDEYNQWVKERDLNAPELLKQFKSRQPSKNAKRMHSARSAN